MSTIIDGITRWRPQYWQGWEKTAEGGTKGKIEAEEGVVELFAFPGDARNVAFTSMEMWIYPHRYHVSIPRHYHDRWLTRLAIQFAWQCGKMSES